MKGLLSSLNRFIQNIFFSSFHIVKAIQVLCLQLLYRMPIQLANSHSLGSLQFGGVSCRASKKTDSKMIL